MRKSSNRKSPSAPLACTASLAMALALLGCSERAAEQAPSPRTAADVFKDSPQSASPSAQEAGTPAAPRASPPEASNAGAPEQLFFRLGCPACHGPGRIYAANLVKARSKPPEEIARWILHPQKIRPGTLMPSYASRLSEEQALVLANWIKAGNPPPPESR